MRYANYFSRDKGNTVMAMKKKEMGSDRGAKAKANAAEKEAKVVRSNKAQSGRLTAQADKKKSQAKVNEMARYQKVQRDADKIFKKAREREAARKSETARKAKQKDR
jgi:hypothetical protein